jgi:ABC-type phosphate/phosphonate transport system substrate-binding protein
MRCTSGVLPACLALWLSSLAPLHAGDTPLRIGIPETFYHDMSPALIREVTDPFADVLRETSGLKGEAVTGGKPLAVARQLHENKLQLAVLHGFEFAWAQQQYPDLQPLMIADRTSKDYRACILVRKDAAPPGFADLKGKDLAIPKKTGEGCRLFLDKLCEQNGAKRPNEYFAHIVRPTDIETGLDDLARGKYPAVLVDTNGLEFYKDLRPGVFGRFKVLVQSEPFAPLVIAYHKGALPEATLTRIRDGLRAAGKTENGREMMKTWRIRAFSAVPEGFAQAMAVSLKRYPPPKGKE